MRCFTAIALSESWRAALADWISTQSMRSRDVRWCAAEQLHITLTFLGEVEEADISDVCAAVVRASTEIAPFAVTLGGIGAFPSRGYPRVLWAGVDDPQRGAARWVSAAAGGFEGLGFPRDSRPYTPHITLARSRSAAGGKLLQRVVTQAAPRVEDALEVREVVLYESRLGPAGAVYEVVARAPLGG